MMPQSNDLSGLASTIYLIGKNVTLAPPPLRPIHCADGVAFNGLVVTSVWLINHTICVPERTYQWGLSSLMLLTFLVMTILFVAMIATLQLDVYDNSQIDHVSPESGVFPDVLNLADEMRTQLGDHIWHLSASELDAEIKKQPDAITVETDLLPMSRRDKRKLISSKAYIRKHGDEPETHPLKELHLLNSR